MLYYQTIEPLELLKDIMNKEYLNQFVLVGGIALALQLGHCKSIDIDLFTVNDFDTNILAPQLIYNFEFTTTLQLPQTLICSINSVKVDFIRFKYPFIRPFKIIDEIRMLDIENIAPMKLNTVAG